MKAVNCCKQRAELRFISYLKVSLMSWSEGGLNERLFRPRNMSINAYLDLNAVNQQFPMRFKIYSHVSRCNTHFKRSVATSSRTEIVERVAARDR